MDLNALELARKIKNDIIKSITLAKIACILDDDKILDEALGIAKGMDLLHYSEALSKIAIEMAKAKRFDDALNMANEVVEERFRLDALETIASYLCDVGKFDKALEVAKNLKYRSQRALSNLSVNLAMAGDFEKSLQVAEMIREKSWKAETLAKIGYVFYEANRPYEELFDKALDVVRCINDKAIRSRTLLKIAIELAKTKKDYRTVLNEGLRIEKNDMDILNLITGLVETNEIDTALRAVEFIKEKYWKVEALLKIAHASSKKIERNMFENAINVARSIKDKSTSSESLLKIAVEMANSGYKYDDIADIVEEAIENIKDVDDFLKSKVLTNAVIDFLKIGDINKALEFSNNIVDDIYKSEVLFYVSSKLAKNKELNEAMEIANGISDDYWKSKALSCIAVETISPKDFEKL
ncbi:hypothetical protein DRP05_12550 [Archaeoglobales archaeon]|nr:MAG: hypothetical protein DRP05_12550 [Archaeoglobales archaeon]